MASAFPNSTPVCSDSSKPVVTGFRLGNDHFSDASESEGDQSALSERSPSPSGTHVHKSKSKKKKERKQVGALTDELGTLLGGAFSGPNGSADDASGIASQATGEQKMDIEKAPTGQKLSKRTRQNLAKMERRKARHERWTQDRIERKAAAAQNITSLNGHRQQKSQMKKKKSAAEARREKKEKQRAKKAAAEGDAMEIG